MPNNINTFHMKKTYLSPEVEITRVNLEENFLTSDPTRSAAPDLIFEDEVDPW